MRFGQVLGPDDEPPGPGRAPGAVRAAPKSGPGDRAHHPIDRLTDWMVMTPLGMVTPRSMHVRRMVKEQPEVVSMVKLMSEVLNAGPN